MVEERFYNDNDSNMESPKKNEFSIDEWDRQQESGGRGGAPGAGGGRRGVLRRTSSALQQWNQRRRTRQLEKQPRQQGTEVVALQQLAKNRQHFKYPPCGFVTRIEFSLLYTMLCNPQTYPPEAVKSIIMEEDFTQYMELKDSKAGSFASSSSASMNSSPRQSSSLGNDNHHGKEGGDEHDRNPSESQSNLQSGNDSVSASTSTSTTPNNVSYAQLSAILAYGAECYPATGNTESDGSTTATNTSTESLSVSECLCKRILNTVVKYAQTHKLERQNEIMELFDPVQRYLANKIDSKELKQLAVFYVGYSAAIITSNPLPLLAAGWAITSPSNTVVERQNMISLLNQTDRKADVERVGLLDEMEDDED